MGFRVLSYLGSGFLCCIVLFVLVVLCFVECFDWFVMIFFLIRFVCYYGFWFLFYIFFWWLVVWSVSRVGVRVGGCLFVKCGWWARLIVGLGR